MKRWHEEVSRTVRNRKQLADYSPEAVRELGRYRKKHGLDCGKVKCRVCHYSKVWGQTTYKDMLSDIVLKEQMREV